MRRLALAGAALLAVLVIAEVGARTLAPHLPEPDLWADDTTTVKVAQLAAIDCVDVVFAGNSMTRDGLDPAVWGESDEAGRVAYNAALDAATPALLERWVPEEVLPHAQPAGVVVGLSSFDLNDEAAIGRSALLAHDRAPLSRDDLLGRLQAPLIRSFDLFAHRGELRDPQTVWDALGAWRDGERAPRRGPDGLDGLLGPQGQGLSRRDLRYTPSPLTDRFARNELLNDFHLGGEQTRAAAELLGDLTGRGIDTAVVVLPVTEDYVGLHPGGEAEHRAFLLEAERLADEAGATFLDLHDRAPDDSWFADTHHLNATGATAVSRELPDLLDPTFASGRRCTP